MRRELDGAFDAHADAPAGTRYGFRISDDLIVPDPASRAQPEGVHGLSMVIDPGEYVWRTAGWRGRPWHEAVILELHAGLLGGFAGLRAQLPRIAAQGFTAIELMPIAQFPGSRNWGYDGVQLYAPQWSYGGPGELQRLVDDAHSHGLMVLLDVVYNHFGPDGNYLPLYAAPFFRRDHGTLWGNAIDVSNPMVGAFFEDNAVYWLTEFRIDGLRLDAVHAIGDTDWLERFARNVRKRCGDERAVHLVLENDGNNSGLLSASLFDAQWNDDGHHVLHRLLTGERDGYYTDYDEKPGEKLARVLGEGFLFQGQASPYRNQAVRGEPSAHLPPSAFVLFLQNHDQIGNRALGERLTSLADSAALRAALALLLLSPQIPLLFIGEESGETAPFLYFTDHEPDLAAKVREGRRREFAQFQRFHADRVAIPDPNDPGTFEASVPYRRDDPAWRALVEHLLVLRNTRLSPHLKDCRSAGASALADRAIQARWRLADGSILTLFANLGPADCRIDHCVQAAPLFEIRPGIARSLAEGVLPACATAAFLEEDR